MLNEKVPFFHFLFLRGRLHSSSFLVQIYSLVYDMFVKPHSWYQFTFFCGVDQEICYTSWLYIITTDSLTTSHKVRSNTQLLQTVPNWKHL